MVGLPTLSGSGEVGAEEVGPVGTPGRLTAGTPDGLEAHRPVTPTDHPCPLPDPCVTVLRLEGRDL